MAEEKPDSENPGCDLGKNTSSDTTSVADPTQDRIEDEAPIPQAPNFPLLVLSWGCLPLVSTLLYVAGMGCYGGSSSEAKLAFTTLLAGHIGGACRLLSAEVGLFRISQSTWTSTARRRYFSTLTPLGFGWT